MTEKNLIDPKHVKGNNPNDDEEIIKNNPDLPKKKENEDEDEKADKPGNQQPAAG